MEPEPLPLKKRKRKKAIPERKTTEVDDNNLCEKSRTWHLSFLKRLSDFETFDPAFNNAFALDWMAQIEALEKHPSDETFVDSQQEISELVKHKIEDMGTLLQSIEYYAQQAFPTNTRVLMEFGFDKMAYPAQTGTPRLAINAYALLMVLTDYEADLLSAGMPATLKAEFETACDKLGEAEIGLEYHKRLRIRSTTQRIRLFNTLFETHQKVDKAAHVIYLKQPEISKQFELKSGN